MPKVAKISITYHLPVPVGHPRHGGSINGVPLWCGKSWAHDTPVTYCPERVTCKRCKKLDDQYREDLDHKRTQQKLESLKQIEMAAE
jgi:hypothetical protein